MNLQKYVGSRVELMYVDAAEVITKRRVKILSVTDITVKAYDYTRGPRTFRKDNILALQPVLRYVV